MGISKNLLYLQITKDIINRVPFSEKSIPQRTDHLGISSVVLNTF